MATKRVAASTPVAYVATDPGKEWPGKIKWDGPGFYEVLTDDKDDHTQADFGKKVVFQLDRPNKKRETPDPQNNEGHFVYADSVNDGEGEE